MKYFFLLFLAMTTSSVSYGAPTPSICERTWAIYEFFYYRNPHAKCGDIVDSDLANVLTLNLFQQLSSFHKGDFNGFTNLEVLYIDRNYLDSIEPGFFNELKSLRILSATGSRISSLARGTFDGLMSLRELKLNSNEIFEISDGVFSKLGNLEILNLAYNKIPNLKEDLFDGLDSLKSLTLEGNQINEIGLAFANLRELKYLDLSSNKLKLLNAISFIGLEKVEDLSLMFNEIEQVPESMIKSMKSLKKVHLQGNNLNKDELNQLRSKFPQIDFIF